MISVENHNICKLCDNAKFDKPCPTCTDLAWEGFSIKEHDKQIRADAIDDLQKLYLDWQKEIKDFYYADEETTRFLKRLKIHLNLEEVR